MTRTLGFAAAVALLATGCGLIERFRDRDRPPPGAPTFSQYHAPGWQWDGVARVVVLPFRNESQYTRAGEEMREAFVAEMQKVGRFEVVPTAPDDRAYLAALSRCGGRFDEALLHDIACATSADVLVYGVVTNFSPYPRPRLGVVLQAVGPGEAKVVASVDGLWDSTDRSIAERLRVYYRQRCRERPPWVRNAVIDNDDNFAAERALESPSLYRRFVAREAVLALLGYPVPGVVMGADGALTDYCPPGGAGAGCAECRRLGKSHSCTHTGP